MKRITIFSLLVIFSLFSFPQQIHSNPIATLIEDQDDPKSFMVYDINKTKEMIMIQVDKKMIEVSGFVDYAITPSPSNEMAFILVFPVVAKKNISMDDIVKRYKSIIKSDDVIIKFNKCVINDKLSDFLKPDYKEYVVYDIWYDCQSNKSVFRVKLSCFQDHMAKSGKFYNSEKIFNIYIPLFENKDNDNRKIDDFQINVTGKEGVSFYITSEHKNIKIDNSGFLILPEHNKPIGISAK